MSEEVACSMLIFMWSLRGHYASVTPIVGAPVALTGGLTAKVPVLSLVVDDARVRIHTHVVGLAGVTHRELSSRNWQHTLELHVKVAACRAISSLGTRDLNGHALLIRLVWAQSQRWRWITTTLPLLEIVHKSSFHNPLQLLLGTVLDEVDHVLLRILVEALGHKSRFGN